MPLRYDLRPGRSSTGIGTIGAQHTTVWCVRLVLIPIVAAIVVAPALSAAPDADRTIRQFLAQDDTQPPYRALRRIEAQNGSRHGWVEAITEFAPESGFRYQIAAEGGSGYIRSKVLRAVLDAEQEVIAHGETTRSSLAPANYIFEANGIGDDGLASVRVSPRRKERILVSGIMLLHPDDGRLVQLRGRLAKNPSFWVTNVEITRSYASIEGAVLPVALESRAHIRMLGPATLRMTYDYTHVGGRALSSELRARLAD